MSRTVKVTEKIEDEILDRIANGEPLKDIVADKHMPCRSAVYWRLYNHSDFEFRYELARHEAADMYFDQLVGISDGIVDVDDAIKIARDRLKIDTRKWTASRLFPRRYGDAQQVAISGPDAGPVEQVTRIVIVAEDAPLSLPAPDDRPED